MDRMLKVGPCGSNWGNEWNDKGKSEITQIFIRREKEYICSIQTTYIEDGTSKLLLSERHGGDGHFFDLVNLDYPSEFLTSVSGYYSGAPADIEDCGIFLSALDEDRSVEMIISSLTFGTNRRTYGPYGEEEGTPFCFQMGNLRGFGGFHGYSNYQYLCSIGVYVKAIGPPVKKEEPSASNLLCLQPVKEEQH